jgi:AcrR family transcriptional regulator
VDAVEVDAAPRRPNARGLRNREVILDRAQELLVAEGFGALNLLRIAGAAGMSRPGLLRHFASTDEILAALMQRLTAEDREWLASEHIDLSDADDLVRLAEINESRPGFVRLFSGLAGPATSPTHPAHSFFADRYRVVRATMADAVSRVRADIDATAEAARLTAGWDGLQLLSCYDPAVRVAEELRSYFDGLGLGGNRSSRRTPASPEFTSEDFLGVVEADIGYPVGQRRRAAILDRAAAHFAQSGFHGSNLAEIARDLGVAKGTLLHHFASKDAILLAVLSRRDATFVAPTAASSESATEQLLALGRAARETEADGRLQSLYVVLSGEGSSPAHPAHEFFRGRFERVRGYLEGLLERVRLEGGLPADADIAHEALWLTAVWDGLQIQALFEPETIDVGRMLDDHIQNLVGGARQPNGGS